MNPKYPQHQPPGATNQQQPQQQQQPQPPQQQPPRPPPPTNLDVLIDFLLGGLSAAISTTISAPVEKVKLLLQTQRELVLQGRLDRPYSGAVDCMSRTYSNEGLLSFWRGNSAAVLRYFPTQALNFAFKTYIQKKLAVPENAGYWRKFLTNLLAGTLAGAYSLFFLYVFDLARTRLATDIRGERNGKPRQFTGIFDVIRKTIETDGVGGLYKGFGVSVLGVALYRGFYFGLFDTLRPFMNTWGAQNGKPSMFVTFIVGWMITIFSGFITYPLDTLRRRQMVRIGELSPYLGTWDAFRTISKTEGIFSLFTGAGSNVARGISGSIVLTLYDILMARALAPQK